MKKPILTAAVVMGLLLNGQVMAAGPVETDSLKGPALGAIAGAILAGPPGVVVGMIGGGLLGHIEMQQGQLDQMTRHQAVLQEKLLEQMQTSQHKLHAITDGFSFCLRFRTESADIEPAIFPHLDALASMLNAFPQLDINVLAASDRRGTESYNQELAKRRAQAVVQRLIDSGVSPQRVRMQIRGEGVALYPENDLEGLGFDRYVVLSLKPGDAS